MATRPNDKGKTGDKMKIVRFKDGTFAIRRWFLGYEFLDNDEIKTSRDTWWTLLSSARFFKISSYEETVKRLQAYKNKESKPKKIVPDYGKFYSKEEWKNDNIDAKEREES